MLVEKTMWVCCVSLDVIGSGSFLPEPDFLVYGFYVFYWFVFHV